MREEKSCLGAVILNDTRADHHFGCYRVMRVIEKCLLDRGINVLASSYVRNDWPNDRAFTAAMAKSDLILINGEGTCHHGSRHAEKLLRVVDHPARGNKPVALINALYQDNPPEWRRYLEKIDVLWARDSWSAGLLRETTGRNIPWTFDLSLIEKNNPRAGGAGRDLLTIGESVLGNTRRELINLVEKDKNLTLLPIIKTIKNTKNNHGAIYRVLRDIYIRTHTVYCNMRLGNAVFSHDEEEYVSRLLRSYLHVTGRFHAVCFALTTLTPVLAVQSNSWKIEALISDVGISSERIIDTSQLRDAVANPHAHTFSNDEVSAIESALTASAKGSNRMFDEIHRAVVERKARAS